MKDFFLRFYKTKRPASVFIRTFLMLVVFAVIPVLSMALFFSGIAERFWKSEGYRFNQSAFLQYTNQVDNKIRSAQETASQLADNPSVLSFMTNPTFSEVQRNTLIMKALNDIQTADNGMDQIYLFSNFAGLVLTSDKTGFTYDEFFDKEALDIYSSGLWAPLVRRTYTPAQGEPMDFITIYQNIPRDSSDSLGCLILNMEKNFLFSAQDSSALLEMTVYDESGRLLYAQNPGAEYVNSPDFAKELYRSPGTFTYRSGKEDMVILNTFSPITGWSYVGAAPMPVFFNSYRSISRLLSVIAVITLIVSFFLAVFIAYRVYLPVKTLTNFVSGKKKESRLPGEYQYLQDAYKNMADKNENMESVLKSMRPAVKNDLFSSLLDKDIVSEEDVLQKLNFIGENFTLHSYGCIAFQISDYKAYIRDFDENSQMIHSYSLGRMADEITEAFHYPSAFVKTARSSWAYVVNITEDTEEKRQENFIRVLQMFRQKFSAAAMPFFHMGFGRLYDDIFSLTYSYREALESIKFQMYTETPASDNVLSIDDAIQIPDTKLNDSLMEAVRTGSKEEAVSQCNALFSNMEERSFSAAQAAPIASGIVNSIVEILIGLGIDTSSYMLSDYYKRLDAASSVQELCSCTEGLVSAAAEDISLFHKKHSTDIIQRLIDYINSHLSEDISLNDLASFSHLSAPYVSRLFKENLNVGFVEYVNTQRIAKARQLLKNTTLTVEQIGFQVGFNNVRSFMRTFKKYENTTPGQYRLQAKEES